MANTHETLIKNEPKALVIHSVSTQRETLNAFFEYLDNLNKKEYNADSLDGHKRKYLKSI